MDARALLRAQKAAAKVQHPYAAYNASGQLRCIVCAVPVKQWDAHLLTKQHRQSAQREKQEEAKRAAAAAKRKQAEPEPETESAKRPRTSEPEADDGPSLPAGFFSSGNRPSVADEDDEDAEEEKKTSAPSKPTEGDPELDAFLASLNEDEEDAPAPTAAEQGETAKTKAVKKRRPGYKEVEEGVASYSAAPVLIKRTEEGEEKEPTPEPEETEQERRERLAREEKEEIIARLEEEQRAQEDADNRVLALKARMEALKKKREAKKAKASG